jgi:hypothetical protein
MKRWFWWGIGIVVVFAIVWWLGNELSKPLPGQAVADLGREHVPDGTKVNYNSNPPTSGPHFVDWTRAGVYDKPVSDGHLVHSLEHGYVIISYNCLSLQAESYQPISYVLAHEEELVSTSSAAEATDSAEITDSSWQSKECYDLISRLTAIYERKGKRKLIVIPRPNLDTLIALTAWTRIDKLDKFDEKRIENFIDAWRDKGPEKTME